MTYDTIETAYAKAREAQRRGLNTIEIRLPAGRHTMALRIDVAVVLTEGLDSGVDGLVVRRLMGATFRDPESGIALPGKIETLLVRASVTDVLEMARASVERDVRPLPVIRRQARPRGLSHLMSR